MDLGRIDDGLPRPALHATYRPVAFSLKAQIDRLRASDDRTLDAGINIEALTGALAGVVLELERLADAADPPFTWGGARAGADAAAARKGRQRLQAASRSGGQDDLEDDQ